MLHLERYLTVPSPEGEVFTPGAVDDRARPVGSLLYDPERKAWVCRPPSPNDPDLIFEQPVR